MHLYGSGSLGSRERRVEDEGGFIVAGGDVVPSGKMISITQLGRDVGKERPDVELKWKEIELTIDFSVALETAYPTAVFPIWPTN